MKTARVGAIALIALIIVSSSACMQVSSTVASEDTLQAGPYIDKIVYKVIPNYDQGILALQVGEIEMDAGMAMGLFYSNQLPMLEADSAISVKSFLSNGFYEFAINCAKYPLNISGVRRAFAFAFDKMELAQSEEMKFPVTVIDALIPIQHPWCIEEKLEPHYYEARPDIGNDLLDSLGFQINATTGYRETPNREPFEIRVLFRWGNLYTPFGICQRAVDAFELLHIDTRFTTSSFPDGPLVWSDCDVYCRGSYFGGYDLDWLGDEYWSANANDDQEMNLCNFQNDTFDCWRGRMLNATSEAEVHEAVVKMQEILHYNVPRLSLFQPVRMIACRNDEFTGYVDDKAWSALGPWTMRKIHKIDGTWGGTVPIAIDEEPDSFNIFNTTNPCPAFILENLWPSLYNYGPDLKPYPDLAERMLTETHTDNPAVSEGHIRYTIDIIHNATWSDGIPLTAEDVAFTFSYILESGAYGNPALEKLEGLAAAYSPSTYRFVIEFSPESYWHFSKFAYTAIIPEHIFNNNDGIGYENWNVWNPILNPEDPLVTCGPFLFSSYISGLSYEFVKNSLFYYRVEETNITETTTTRSTEMIDYGTLEISIVISSVSGVVIVIFSYLTYLELEKNRLKLRQIP